MYCNETGEMKSDTITSPNHPKKYPNNADETRTIEVGLDNRIFIEFTEMNIEYHSSCRYDWVQVKDADGQELFKGCGRELPNNTIISNTNKVFINFHSDSSITAKGFLLKFSELERM